MRALIVDDDFIGRNLLLKYLRDSFACDVAVSGDEARTAFQLAWTENDPYDVIYLDIVIPGISGFEVLEYIRDFEKKNSDKSRISKIIMVSALDHQEQVLKAYKNKCDGYIIKPITIDKMLNTSKEAGVSLPRL